MNEPTPKAVTESRRNSADVAYVLHAQPWRETSLLLETFTQEHGRVVMVARGARRPRSALRGLLLAFHPLTLAWIGKGEVRTLTRAEWQGGQRFLRGESLLCGYYLNELLLRLLPREDAHERLFERYGAALSALADAQGDPRPPMMEETDSEAMPEARAGSASGVPAAPASVGQALAAVLRAFEKALLAELGYALTLNSDAAGAAIESAAAYRYDFERGPLRVTESPRGARPAQPQSGASAAGPQRGAAVAIGGMPVIHGQTLLELGRDDFTHPRTLAEAKNLMRSMINHRLDNVALKSRRVYRDLLDMATDTSSAT